MTVIIINPKPPWWVREGLSKPPKWMWKYFPKMCEKELMRYGKPEVIAEYFVNKMFKRIDKKMRSEVGK